jgi:hypothetical protein
VHLLSQAGMFIYGSKKKSGMWEVGVPPSPVEFSFLCHSHKLSHSWFLGACSLLPPELSGQAWLVYLRF